MLRHWLTRASRCAAIAAAGLVAAGLVLPAGSAAAAVSRASTVSATTAATTAAAKVKAVSYRGYTFKVPSSWPVFRLSRHPATCVRFDLHAVYLGTPGANQKCPSWLLGATEAVVIEPGPASAPRSSQEDPVSDEITAQAPGIRLSATFDTDPTSVYRILASAGLAAPLITAPNPARLAAAAAGTAAPGGAAAGDAARELTVSARSESGTADAAVAVGYPELPASVSNFAGLGFDVCAAPSASYMSAWREHSPYGAVGIYIGGSDRACDQQNLTASWVRREAAAGWRFVPMYAGPQASFGQLKSPASQGVAAAEDAVVQAEHLGFGPRAPLYYDMEAYSAGQTGNVLRFLSAWTTELHKLGFMSGVYSSSDSAVVDLARQYKKGEFAMPDVIYDALWNGSRNLDDSVYESGEWTGGRRMHQFSGDVLQTYGGDTLDIDQDDLDVTLPTPGGTTQDSPGATSSGDATTLFYRGTDHHLWSESAGSGGHWTRSDLGGYLTSAPSVVQVGTSTLDVFYRGRDGWLWERARVDGRWSAARELPMMGDLGSGPRAVAQPNGVIDLFWKGSHDPHLWHGQYDPHRGWAGPQDLQGTLDGPPYPVETASGAVQVFWDGTDGKLWRVIRGLGDSWSAPQDFGMGILGGPPHAVAQPDGEVDVFWRGSTETHTIWSAELKPGRRAIGPLRVAGQDPAVGQPWPALSGSSERVLFRGGDSRMWLVQRAGGGRWGTPVKVSRLGAMQTAPVAAAGPRSAPLEVFWTNSGRHLVTAPLTVRGSWGKAANLGGSVTQATASG